MVAGPDDRRSVSGAGAAAARDPVTTVAPAAYLEESTYATTRAPVEQASTLLPDAYRSPDYHRIEQERVFAGGWVAVGFAEQVSEPGDVHVARVAGRSVLVTRNRDGRLRAFHNVCRHRAAELVVEDCSLRRFRCPYHSWTYDLDGRLLGAPLFEGSAIPDDQRALFDTDHVAGFDPEDMGLLPVRVDAFAHLVFVDLSAGAPPLRTWLGDLPERLAGYRLDEARILGGRPYEIAANWKLIAENFMEYYHLPWVHPELVKVSRVEDHYRWQGPGLYTGMCTSPVTQDEDSGWSALGPLPGLSDVDAVSGRFVHVFPNVSLSVLPNHVFTMLLEPTSVGATLEHTALAIHDHHAPGPTTDTAVARLLRFWDHLNREDIEVVERVQRGIANPAYAGGRMCYRFEEPVHRFQNIVIDRMVGIDRVPPGDDRQGPLVGTSADTEGRARRPDDPTDRDPAGDVPAPDGAVSA
jgi:choline monooxygenase